MGNISKEILIKEIEKSWKFEGYCFVTLTSDLKHPRKRKCYERKTGKFAGKVLINLNCDIYSFVWGNDNKAKQITWVGNYKSISDAEGSEVVKKEPKAPHIEVPTGEVFHPKFDKIKQCVNAQLPVYLAGPAGSGKNHTLEQVAKALNIEFYFTNSVQQEYQLTGFVDAGGKYHDTQFYRACKKASEGVGTMFFLDEMDASIPEVLVKLNMAIAQGYFEFPNGEVLNFKENIHWVAAGNTVGSGADEMYTGRMVLDQASLDRFVIIEFGYAMNIEASLAKGDIELVTFIEKIRKQADEKGIRATFSYRCITMVAKLKNALDLVDILEIAVFKGLDKDTIKTFKGDPTGSSYDKALVSLQKRIA